MNLTSARKAAVMWVVAALLAACGGSSSTASPTNSAPIAINVQHYMGNFEMIALYAAKEEGFFEKHGLIPNLLAINNGTAAAAALVNGSVDVLFHAPTFIIPFIAKGQNLNEIAENFQAPIYHLVGRPSKLNSCASSSRPYPAPLECLKGQKVGITALGSDNYNVMVALLKDAHLTKDDVSLVALGGAVQLATAFQANQLDYLIASEPAGTQLVDVLGIGVEVINLAANPAFKPWDGQATFALADRLAANPEMFKRFAATLADGIKFVSNLANQDKAVADFKKYSALDDNTILSMIKKHAGEWKTTFNCAALDGVNNWLFATGQITEAQKIPCKTLIWKAVQGSIK